MNDLHIKIQKQFSKDVLEVHNHRGDETVVIKKTALIEILKYLKENSEFQMNVLMDITAVDGLDMKWNPRFMAVYHLFSLSQNHRLRLKVPVEESDLNLSTASNLWPVANWLEREVWDMFGIHFEGHPNMKRMLMYEEFEGHALRKDYPYNKRQPLIGPKN